MIRIRKVVSLSILLALAVSGCQSQPEPLGSVQLAASLQQLTDPSDVSRVTVTWSRADTAPTTVELTRTNGTWGGVISNIPAASGLIFLGEAFDANGNKLYEGQTGPITISANQTTLVAITLLELNPPLPFTNQAPIIDSLVAFPTTVPPGGSVSLIASARDPNAGDALSHAWTATTGSFANSSSTTASWSAPDTTGIATLTLTVTDSQGVAVSFSLAVNVAESTPAGDAAIEVRLNHYPVVSGITSPAARVGLGQATTLSALATDRDGDPLSYEWTASCSGAWSNATSSTASFTPISLPSGACNNCQITVSVSDGRGAQTEGTLELCVVDAQVEHFPPVIVRAYQSSLTAQPSQQLTFELVASDPENSALSFSWSASAGTLGAAQDSATSSHMIWQAPGCAPEGNNPSIIATVTNAYGLSSMRTFMVGGLPACPPAGWSMTGSLAMARHSHTATLLPSGKVLVVGGTDGTQSLATAEVYNPANGLWSATGSLATPRYSHTATLLPSGKVLVLGGYGPGGAVATAEVYDPATGSWSSAEAMATARYMHGATLLASGKVLISGGLIPGTAFATAEVYDPASNSWSATGSMATPRHSHTTLVLPSGRVLITGGYNFTGGAIETAELYDPVTGTWSDAGTMSTPKYAQTATLLPSGQVLVAGGHYFASDPYRGVGLRMAEVYDPATSSWTISGSMTWDRSYHTATLLASGKVLVAAGNNLELSRLGTSELFDPATGSWTLAGTLAWPRHLHTATRLSSGKVLIVGGFDGAALASAELYTP